MRLFSSARSDGTIRPVAPLRRTLKGEFVRPHASVLTGFHWDDLLGFWVDKRGVWDPILEKTMYDDKEKVVAKARLERHHQVLREFAIQEVVKTTGDQGKVKGTKKRARHRKDKDLGTHAELRKRVKIAKSGRKPCRPKKDRERNSLVDSEQLSTSAGVRETHHIRAKHALPGGVGVPMADGQEMDLSEIQTVEI